MSNQCGACFYYRVDPRNLRQGTCRFNPPAPAMVGTSSGQPMTVGMFPPVQEGEWCGKWQSKAMN